MKLTHVPVLPALKASWSAQGWSLDDLARFRMEGDGGDGGAGDGTGSGATPPPAPVPAVPEPPTRTPEEEVEHWRGIAKLQEKRAKDNVAAATELAALKESQKSEETKREERTAAAEKSAAENATKATRLEVALEKGLPKELAARLQGGTKEEMEADADELLKLVQPAAGGGSLDLGQGGRGGSNGEPTDMNSLLRRAAGRG